MTKNEYKGVITEASKASMGRDNLMFAEVEAAGGDDPHIITREHIEVVREGLAKWYRTCLDAPEYKKYIDLCTQTIFQIKDSDGNDMDVYIVKAKKDEGKKGMAALINFNGGGGYSGSPELEIPWASRIAHENGVVFISIKFRLAPEVQYPTGAKDAVAAIEYFYNNAEKHSLDKSRLCTTGMSGGAWITMTAAILMGREKKNHMVKLMILNCPALSDHFIHMKREEVEPWENPLWPFRQDWLMMHTLDVAGNINDPLLFPGKLGQDEMKNLPPAVLSTSEFDFMRRDVHMVIPEMKKAGIYLDHMDYSGVCHMFQVYPDDPQTILWFADMKKAIAAYLLC